mmetsp:Transcript_20950/g.50465  ORF Transcript_20950/g.50465 Transcript_20950/m.50465 type:complete len:206 (-) Transcript_20950:126-743(-)
MGRIRGHCSVMRHIARPRSHNRDRSQLHNHERVQYDVHALPRRVHRGQRPRRKRTGRRRRPTRGDRVEPDNRLWSSIEHIQHGVPAELPKGPAVVLHDRPGHSREGAAAFFDSDCLPAPRCGERMRAGDISRIGPAGPRSSVQLRGVLWHRHTPRLRPGGEAGVWGRGTVVGDDRGTLRHRRGMYDNCPQERLGQAVERGCVEAE